MYHKTTNKEKKKTNVQEKKQKREYKSESNRSGKKTEIKTL